MAGGKAITTTSSSRMAMLTRVILPLVLGLAAILAAAFACSSEPGSGAGTLDDRPATARAPAPGPDDDEGDDSADDDTAPPVPVAVGGRAVSFDPGFGTPWGAAVGVVQRPDLPVAITEQDGSFRVEGLFAGDEMALVLTFDDYFPTQTATLVLPERGIADVSIQTPPGIVAWALAAVLRTDLDPDLCQIAATVSPPGGGPYSEGVPGARVRIDPPLPADHGPFYFLYFDIPGLPVIDLPIRGLDATTDDGGVVFVNVPPGRYVLTAEKEGTEFTPATIDCRPGVLVNASPPHGLQAIDPAAR
jgi:hypothetical protein